ncbi:hypothetical protein EDB92DRAFT_1762167, partial [Lactarius akahatsu]
YRLTVRWTAGHVGIEGNEKADEEAKAAAEGKTSPASDLPRLLKKPLTDQQIGSQTKVQKRIKDAWKKEWSSSPRADRLKRFDSTIPSNKFLKLM